MKTKNFLRIVLVVLLVACSKDDGPQQKDPDPVAEPVQKSSDKQMISFRFAGIDADGITVDISAEIDEQARAITATMPSGTDITALEPSVEISPKATLDPEGAQDFTSPINYTVTAEDGTSTSYEVMVTIALSQKEILLLISVANPGNTLEWNEEDNLSDWEEVTLDGNGNITELHLSNSGLPNLPPEIGQLTNLQVLSLTNNRLGSLPQEIGQLANLQVLSLAGNELQLLPPEIGQLANLQVLSLVGNELQSLPPEIGQLANLQELSLFANELRSLPPELWQLTNLQVLSLSSNELQSLPPEIGQLANLQELRLAGNELQSLPPEFGQLTNLQELSLNNNKLGSLPIEMGQLVNLRALDLRNNNLSQFNYVPFISSGPITLGCSTETNLETLYLAGNADLEVLDQCICDLDLENGGMVNIDVVPDKVRCEGDVITGKN